mmetsp:Transcript_34808/g.91128  ORF Transcript_34808/g.91128 Transcript_34808/m.91128 type:complete len:220 (+) Transcript_34808:48-707(+)
MRLAGGRLLEQGLDPPPFGLARRGRAGTIPRRYQRRPRHAEGHGRACPTPGGGCDGTVGRRRCRRCKFFALRRRPQDSLGHPGRPCDVVTDLHPGMSEGAVDIEALVNVDAQQPGDQILGRVRHVVPRCCGIKPPYSVRYLLPDGVFVPSHVLAKGREAREADVQDNAARPHVDRVRVLAVAVWLEHLWGLVGGGPHQGAAVPLRADERTHPEVGYLHH